MNKKSEISIYDFVNVISEAIDLVSPILNCHHKRVAYIAYKIASKMNLPKDEIQNIILASMLHDIGAFSINERIEDMSPDSHVNDLNQHALIGYNLLKGYRPLEKAAELIKSHHTVFNAFANNTPIGSYIILLADMVAVMFDEQEDILKQIPGILEKLSLRYHNFHPRSFSVFSSLAKTEYFWIEAFSPVLSTGILKKVKFSEKNFDLQALREFARVIAQIIDFRSRFTAVHSSGVAAVAHELTSISGFPEEECKQMEIAGFLHDFGKLAVPNDILEMDGAIENVEFDSLRKHTYYTYALLKKINGLEDIAGWAAQHHERQNSDSYAFHKRGKDSSRLAHVMTVADIMTALTEDRPYWRGMSREKTTKILLSMAESNGINKDIVELAYRNFFRINDVRMKAQQEVQREYQAFHEIANQPLISGIKQSA